MTTPPMRRVLHVITSLATGGAEHQLLNVVLATKPAPLRHVVCQLGPPDDLAAPLAAHGAEVVKVGISERRRHAFAFRRVAEVIERVRPDVVQSWLFHARFATALALLGDRSTTHLATLHGTDYEPASIRATGLGRRRMRVQLAIERAMAARSATSFVAVSQAVKSSYVNHASFDPRRLQVIPNSIEPGRFRLPESRGPEVRRRLGIPADAFVFVNVSRLIPGKGHAGLLEAFEAVAERDGKVWLVVAGTGPLGGALRASACSLHARDRIRLLGTRHDVPDLLAAADAFVFPSRSEGFGLVLAEAMAAGVPAIAEGTSAARALAGDDAALLVPAGAPSVLARAMAQLRSDAELRARMASEARKRVVASYSLERVAPAWLAAYGLADGAPA